MKVLYSAAIAVICFLLVFPACKKEGSEPVPNEDTILTSNKLLGRWEVTLALNEVYDSTGTKRYNWRKEKEVGYLESGGAFPIKQYWYSDNVSFIEFKADNTYNQLDKDGNPSPNFMLGKFLPASGRWSLPSSDQMRLTTFYDYPTDTNWTYSYNDGVLGVGVAFQDTTTGPMATNATLYWTIRLERQ